MITFVDPLAETLPLVLVINLLPSLISAAAVRASIQTPGNTKLLKKVFFFPLEIFTYLINYLIRLH